MKQITYSLAQIEKAARFVIDHSQHNRILAFYGEMGAGKTTLIKEICRLLDVKDMVNSPTFAIVYEYKTNNDAVIYHFDFYRIKDIEEVLAIGYEDYFFSGAYCLLEWPEKAEPLLPADTLKINITVISADFRKIEIM